MSSPSSLLFPGSTLRRVVIPHCVHYAGNEKFILKALALQKSLSCAFDVTCDLEDGAVVGDEIDTLKNFISLIAQHDNGRVGLRIHEPQSKLWKHEIKLALKEVGTKLSYIVVPKCSGAEDVKRVLSFLNSESRRRKIKRKIPLHVLIELHGALRDVWKIAAYPQVETLDLGLLDFISDHQGVISERYMKSPGQFEHKLIVRAKTEIVAAANAYGKVAAHNMCQDFQNSDSVFSDAKRAREEFGFLRMWSIHPSQIEPIVKAMQPEAIEIARACKILLAAEKANWGPISYEDKLQDRASYRYYWCLVQQAHQNRAELPEEVMKWFR